MTPIVVIRFNYDLQLGGMIHSTVAENMDLIQNVFQERLVDYHVIALPELPEKVSFFDIQVLNAEHVKEVDFEQFKADIKDQLMKQFNPQ